MKDKMFLFPALILVLTPCVWYSNQPGVDGIQNRFPAQPGMLFGDGNSGDRMASAEGSDLLDWKSAVHSGNAVVCVSSGTDF